MSGIISSNIITIQEKTPPPPKRYGISYDINDSNPALIRLYNAKNMVANAGTSLMDEPQNDFDKVWPFSDIVEETISTRVMMKIPKFYIRRELIDDVMEIVICQEKYDSSYRPHEMFLKGNTQWTGNNPESDYNDYTYVAKYETSTNNQSVANATVQVDQTRATMRTNAKAVGSGWSIMDIATYDGLQKLFLIVFATRDSKSIMNATGATAATLSKTGLTTGSKASCVEISPTIMSFYGIENLYGNVTKFIDGINSNGNIPYVCTDISKYIDGAATNYRQLNYNRFETNGYISKLGFDINNKFAQLTIEANGSSSTYFTDPYYRPLQWSFPMVGGLYLFGETYGATASKTTSSGSRLIYRPI